MRTLMLKIGRIPNMLAIFNSTSFFIRTDLNEIRTKYWLLTAKRVLMTKDLMKGMFVYKINEIQE